MSHEIWTASHSLSWKAICIEYGYTHGDLMYYAHPAKSLDDGLVLISSNMDLLEMVTCHKGHNTIILYVVAFGDEAGHDQENRKRYKMPVVKKGAMDKGKQVIEMKKNLLKVYHLILFGIKSLVGSGRV